MAATGRKSSVIMALGSLLSRALGFVKLFLTLAVLGSATDISDIFAFANQVPNVIYLMIGGGALNAILVPQIVKASRSPDGGELYINKLITLVCVVMGTGTLLVMAGSWGIVDLMGSGWTPERRGLTVWFLLWCLPQVFFYGLYALFGQILNARNQFGAYMWSPVLNNVVAILGLLGFWAYFGSVAQQPDAEVVDSWSSSQMLVLAGTTTLGIVVQALVLVVPLLRSGFRLYPSFGWRGMGFRAASKVAVWALMMIVLNQLTFLVIFWVSANAGNQRGQYSPPESVAGNASYDAAALVTTLPHSIIAVSVATVMFTRMSESVVAKDWVRLRESFSSGQRIIGVVTMFAMVLFIILAGPIGMILGGETPYSGAAFAKIILALSLGIPLFSVNFLYQRVFYALDDARTLFVLQLPVAAAIVGLSLAASQLPPPWIAVGLGFMGNITITLQAFLNARTLKRRVGDMDGARILRTFSRLMLASIASGVAGALVLWVLGGYSAAGYPWQGRLHALIACVPVTLVAGVVYFLALRRLRVEELEDLAGPVLRKLGLGRLLPAPAAGAAAVGAGNPSASEDPSGPAGSGAASVPGPFTEVITVVPGRDDDDHRPHHMR